MRKIPNEEFDRLKVYTEDERIADEKDWEFLIKLNEESIERMKKMPPEYFEEQYKYMEEYTKKLFEENKHLFED